MIFRELSLLAQTGKLLASHRPSLTRDITVCQPASSELSLDFFIFFLVAKVNAIDADTLVL
jgi:hypothetical protein